MHSFAFIFLHLPGKPAHLTFTTLAPNGNSASLAILKNCFPKGIPTIVMHKIQPIIRFPIASSSPETKNHITFKMHDTAPPSSTISFPNGSSDIDDSLKHCSPTGIPTTVMHHNTPASHQPIALKSPPHIIHIKFPKKRILYIFPFSMISISS